MPVLSARPCLAFAIAACLLAGLAGGAWAQAGPASLYRGLDTIEIPYANGPIRAEHVPEIRLRLKGAAPRRFGMDTGSTGIVVAAEHYRPGPGDTDDGPGRIVYNSSGRVLHGTHYTTDVEILHDDDRPAATARVQVLRVESITCLRNARDCRPDPHPRGVAFMGIGFDRGQAQGTEGTSASRNPFVNLVSLASGAPVRTIRPGYIVTRTGIRLGMDEALARNFAFVKLSPRGTTSASGLPQWRAAPLTVSVDGRTGVGTSLVDTGINDLVLAPPPGTSLTHGARAPAGTKIAIGLPGGGAAASAFYEFTVGDRANPLHPEKVEVVRDPGVFVNTGRMFFEGFDYLYDALGGYVGYGWNGRASGAYGRVTPGPR
jgi:hypothetical protein